MTKHKPLILITNDDGFFSRGIEALIDSVRDLGEVVVVAPNGPRSGMSSALSAMEPIRVYLKEKDEDYRLYVCTGTPVDCVKLALNELLVDRMPDLVITGINHGANSAVSVIYSGTMGAAIEGCLFDIPSIGFSLLNHSAEADFSITKPVVRLLCEKVLKEGLPQGTCLNVNIPDVEEIKGLKIVRQSRGKWINEIKTSEDGGKHRVYWLSGEFKNYEPDAVGTDETVLDEGYVSIVPVKIDMTDYAQIEAMKSWEKLI